MLRTRNIKRWRAQGRTVAPDPNSAGSVNSDRMKGSGSYAADFAGQRNSFRLQAVETISRPELTKVIASGSPHLKYAEFSFPSHRSVVTTQS